MRKFITILFALVFTLTLSGCGEKAEAPEQKKEKETINLQPSTSNQTTSTATDSKPLTKPEMIIDLTNKIAIVETNFGTIKFDFYEEEAPELSKNFALLAQDGFYDGLVFHRIIEGFMIQGGDPLGTGTGGHSYKGPGTKIGDEEGALKLRHDRGAVSWAKSSLPNSIGSQFFIVHQNSNFLDGGYSVFGNVIEGIEVVDKIADVETAPGDRPLEDVIMEKVYLEEK